MTRHEAVDGSKLAVADRFRFGRRFEQQQKRGQKRDADDEGDDHAGARDQAELGHAAIVGGKEGVEAGGGRGRGKRQWLCDPRRGRCKSAFQIALDVPLLTVAHRDLDAEIDPDADEEDGESHRDEVQARRPWRDRARP